MTGRQRQSERARIAGTTLVSTAAVALLAALIALGIRLNRAAPRTANTPLTASVASPSPPPQNTVGSSAVPAPEPAADELWRRSLRAESANGTPIQAHVTVLRWTNGAKAEDAPSRRSEFDLWEGNGGRYRLVYTAPTTVQGRLVVCDGKTLWQYEAKRRVVLRRPLAAVTVSSEDEPRPDTPGNGSPAVGMIAHLEPDAVTVEGRPARLLSLMDRRSQRLRGRRWIDTETARSLRTETYDVRTGRTLHRVELSHFRSAPPAEADATARFFQPNFPATAHVVSVKNEGEADTTPSDGAAAARWGMPVAAGGYRLRTVVRSAAVSRGAHLVYSDAAHSISVFVSEVGDGKVVALQPPTEKGKVWQAAKVPPHLAAYTHQDGQGRAGVVWVRAGKRYVAASRLPLPDLMAFVQAINRTNSSKNNANSGKTTP